MTLKSFLAQNYENFKSKTIGEIATSIPDTVIWSGEVFEIAEVLHKLKKKDEREKE
ncbi:hypothetical protein ACQ4M3_13210 [Leptolyngbya sp. AN03gr2]|uniref:hypothetical protein n=1 Tax=unclassified Leptolyngbya TaxID=2650499 RepID=UPI003D310CA9